MAEITGGLTVDGKTPLYSGDEVPLPAPVAPGVPTGLGISSALEPFIAANYTVMATVTWTAPANMVNWTGYLLSYRKQGTGVWKDFPSTSTTVYVPGLELGTIYEFKVKSVGTGDHSAFTATAEHTTAAHSHTPATPDAPTVTAGIRNVVVTWPKHADVDIVRYELYVSTTGINGTYANVANGPNNTFVYATNVAADVTVYAAKYRVVDAAGNTSAFSAVSSDTMKQILDIEVANVPNGYNLLVNADFESGLDGWTTETGAGAVVDATGTIMSGNKMARNTAGSAWRFRSTRLMPVSSQRAYVLEFYIRDNASPTGGSYAVGIQQWDGTKAKIGTDSSFKITGTPTGTFTLFRKVFGYGYTDYLDINCRYITVDVWLNTANAALVQHAVQGVRIREVIESAYLNDAAVTSAKIATLAVKDGHIESLSAAKISLSDPVNGNIKLGKGSASDTAPGFWFGNDGGVPKAHIGNTTSGLKYDGTTTTFTGPVVIRPGSSGYANVTDKPTSLSGINGTEGTKLTGIADGATKNVVTRSASEPANPGNGDIWVDTSVTPNVVKTRIAGAWQVSANLVTQSSHLTDVAAILNSNITLNANGTISGGGGGQVTISGLGFSGALDATRNIVTTSAVAPSSPMVGDLWCDTSGSQNVWKAWTTGGWVVSATQGAPAGTYVGNALAETIATAATNFNGSNDRNAAAVADATIANDGTAIDHTLNTDGSADLSFEWLWGGNEGDIDGFIIYEASSNSSTPLTINPADLSTVNVHIMPANKRALILKGVPADLYYTFGVQAYRKVDKDINAAGSIRSANIKQPIYAGENPYRPSASVAFAGDITGTINNIAVATVTTNAANGAVAYSKFSGAGGTLPAGNVEFNFAASGSKGGNATNTDAVGTQSAATVQTATLNFNGRNDRNAAAVAAPTIAVDGTAIDHVVNTDGSCDISLEWAWAGNNADVDGWVLYCHIGSSSAAYTFGTTPAEEQVLYVTPDRRSVIIPGVAADKYYTFGVQAYRVVDTDIDASGFKKTAIIQPTRTEENPYQPAATVAFAGNISGTINGVAATTITSDIASAISSAATANSLLADIAADNKLTPTEKTQLKREIDLITAQKNSAHALAVAIGVNDTEYIAAYTLLYPNDSAWGLNSLTTTSTIDGPTLRGHMAGYYAAYQELLGRLSPSTIVTNLAPNADYFQRETTGIPFGWGLDLGVNGTGLSVDMADWRVAGIPTLYIYQANGVSTQYSELQSVLIPVKPGTEYINSVFTGAHRCYASLFCMLYDANQLPIADSIVVNGVSRSAPYSGHYADAYNNMEASGGNLLSGYKRVEDRFTTSPTTAYAKIIIRKFDTLAGNEDSYLFFALSMLQETKAGQVRASVFVDSASKTYTRSDGTLSNNLSATVVDNQIITNAFQGTNLSLAATFTDSGSNAGMVYLKDTNRAIGSDYSGPCWCPGYVQADLGSVKFVAQNRAYFYAGDVRRYNYAVAISNDLVTWRWIVGTGLANGNVSTYKAARGIMDNYHPNGVLLPDIDNVNDFCRYLRVYSDGNDGPDDAIYLYEWEILSAGSADDPYLTALQQYTRNELNNIASDSVLSKGEKSAVIKEWETIEAEDQSLIDAAAVVGVSSVTYATAKAVLSSYLVSINYSDTTTDTAITNTEFRAKFADYYAAKTALMKAISDAASAMANSSSNGITNILSPAGGQFSNQLNDVTGAIQIALPVLWNNAMLKFSVEVYNYTNNQAFRVDVGGYLYEGGSYWYGTSAVIIGSGANLPIRFGDNGTKACVWIGAVDSVWHYPKVVIKNVQVGFIGYDLATWSSGWAISIVTQLGHVDVNHGDPLVYAGDTLRVDGTLAATVKSNAANALANAATANGLLTDIASDSKLTPVEKQAVRKEWDIIYSESGPLSTQASALGLTGQGSLDAARVAQLVTLATYLNAGVAWSAGVPSWLADANLGATTDIVGTTFRANWKDYYDARQALLNEMADVASQWATVDESGALKGSGGVVVDNSRITIGGRNLQLDGHFSALKPVYTNNQGHFVSTELVSTGGVEGGSFQRINYSNHSQQMGIAIQNILGWKPNVSYTITIWTKTTNKGDQYSGGLGLRYNVAPSSIVAVANPNVSVAWQKHEYLITWGATVEPNGNMYFTIAEGEGDGNIELDQLQIEEGNKATSWVPATEDLQAQFDAIASDSVLSKGEKSAVIKEWAVIEAEDQSLIDAATVVGVSSAAYATAKANLSAYLISINYWDTTTDTAITNTEFRAKFADYYAAKTALMKLISDAASVMATWAGVSGTGKPADNATVGAVAGTNLKNSGNSLLYDYSVMNNQDSVINFPQGGLLVGATSEYAGAIKIRLPQYLSNTMLKFTVDIYEYVSGYSCRIEIAGYSYAANDSWYNCTAAVVGASSNVEYPVRFGHDGEKACIWIGNPADTWSYPQVRVRDFFAGYSAYTRDLWETGWAISFDTNAATNVTATVLDTYPAANWTKVTGTGRPADNATSNPTNSGLAANRPVGIDGEFYFATDTNILWQKISGVWTQSANNYTNTNQLTDGAALGSTAVWSGVSGTGKPADNATVGANWNSNLANIPANVTSVANLSAMSEILNTSQKLLDVKDAAGLTVFAVTENGAASSTPFYAPMIQAGSVKANWVYAGEVLAGQITLPNSASGNIKLGKTAYSDSTNAGFWLGNDGGTAKLHIGNSTKYVKWDGINLDIRGTLSADDIQSGVLTGRTIQTAASGERFVVSGTDNFARFYGDDGNGTGTIVESVVIGITTDNYNGALGSFGTASINRTAVKAESAGVNSPAMTAYSAGARPGIWAWGWDGFGLEVGGGHVTMGGVIGYKGAMRIIPMATADSPNGVISSDVGALWVTSAGVLFICTGGTNWQKVGAQ